jgi:hypothetical protein
LWSQDSHLHAADANLHLHPVLVLGDGARLAGNAGCVHVLRACCITQYYRPAALLQVMPAALGDLAEGTVVMSLQVVAAEFMQQQKRSSSGNDLLQSPLLDQVQPPLPQPASHSCIGYIMQQKKPSHCAVDSALCGSQHERIIVSPSVCVVVLQLEI